MKKSLLLLFVIMVMALSFNLYASGSIEVSSKIITIKKLNNHTMRFTLEVKQNASLCSQVKTEGECYVLHKEFLKYVYADISKVPYIGTNYAQLAFIRHGIPIEYKTETKESYEDFPWILLKGSSTKYFYVYHNENLPYFFETREIKKDSLVPAYGIKILWCLMIFILFLGISSLIFGFTQSFSSDEGFALYSSLLVVLISVFCLFINGFVWCTIIMIICGIMSSILLVDEVNDNYLGFNVLFFGLVSPLSAIFVIVGEDILCWWYLFPLTLIVMFAYFILSKIKSFGLWFANFFEGRKIPQE